MERLNITSLIAAVTMGRLQFSAQTIEMENSEMPPDAPLSTRKMLVAPGS